ncbi:hypothetical protein JVU11DRAFT_9706 [Chiua virens]|nr:hypothetical protein JVU11DRAFT_9706 [Chiua virens]
MRFISCTITYLLGNWAYPIFWVGADAVMILRVYAIYNRSKLILCLLLLLMYIAEMVILVTESAIYSDQNYAPVSTVQLLDVTICNIMFNIQTWNNATTYAQFALAVVMCILVAAQYARHSRQMYRAQRTWQPNKYISLLVRDSLLYFLVTLLYTLLNLLGLMNLIPLGWTTQVLMAVANIPLYTLTPRFVLNVRELYACDVEGHGGRDIDTGFGLSTERGVGGSPIGTMAFAEGGEIAGLDDAEEIAMVENTRQREKNPVGGQDQTRAAEPLIVHP